MWLFLSFIVATILGTLSHECGHYLAAKFLGHDAILHYASTSWRLLESKEEGNSRDGFLILLAGPLQTLLTGTVGLFLLFLCRKTYRNNNKLSIIQWGTLFLSLFWTRQVANFTLWSGNRILGTQYKSLNDEIKIARHLQIPEWVILTTSALIGLVVLIVILIKFIPKQQRVSFITAGFFGGIFGYVIWMSLLGKHLVP